MLGWTEMIFNHITLRLPDSVTAAKQFLINPFGLHYSEVTASQPASRSTCRASTLRRQPAPGEPAPASSMHAAIHDSCRDAHCVMHTHTTSGMAVACLEGGLSQTTSTARSCTASSRTTTSKASPSKPTSAAPGGEHRRQAMR